MFCCFVYEKDGALVDERNPSAGNLFIDLPFFGDALNDLLNGGFWDAFHLLQGSVA